MTTLGYLLVFLLFLVTQTVFVPFIEIAGVRPDVLLIFLVIFGMKRERIVGTVSGFGIGLIQDLFTAGFLGANALVKTLTGFLVQPFSSEKSRETAVGFGWRFFWLAFLHDLLLSWIFAWGNTMSVWFFLVRFVVPGAVYSTVAALIVFALLPGSFFSSDD